MAPSTPPSLSNLSVSTPSLLPGDFDSEAPTSPMSPFSVSSMDNHRDRVFSEPLSPFSSPCLRASKLSDSVPCLPGNFDDPFASICPESIKLYPTATRSTPSEEEQRFHGSLYGFPTVHEPTRPFTFSKSAMEICGSATVPPWLAQTQDQGMNYSRTSSSLDGAFGPHDTFPRNMTSPATPSIVLSPTTGTFPRDDHYAYSSSFSAFAQAEPASSSSACYGNQIYH